jgi:hypothetical protein
MYNYTRTYNDQCCQPFCKHTTLSMELCFLQNYYSCNPLPTRCKHAIVLLHKLWWRHNKENNHTPITWSCSMTYTFTRPLITVFWERIKTIILAMCSLWHSLLKSHNVASLGNSKQDVNVMTSLKLIFISNLYYLVSIYVTISGCVFNCTVKCILDHICLHTAWPLLSLRYPVDWSAGVRLD